MANWHAANARLTRTMTSFLDMTMASLKVSDVGPEGEINGNRELTAMPGYNELADPRAVGTEREETRWNR